MHNGSPVDEKAPSRVAAGRPIDCRRDVVVHGLYDKVGRAILNRVGRVVRRDDIAREILQETFVRLWQQGPCFEHEMAAFTWLYKTSHNLAIDHVRASFTRSYQDDPADFEQVEAGHCPADVASERRELLARVLGRLSAEEASVLVYKVVDEMTLDEIGELTGSSGKTVSRMLTKIERKLARMRVDLA